MSNGSLPQLIVRNVEFCTAVVRYSYRNASMGFIREAFLAG